MKEIEVTALRNFPYSRYGWDNKMACKGKDLTMSEVLAQRLAVLDPPYIEYKGLVGKCEYTLEFFKKAVEVAENGADTITLGEYVAKQKSGVWYNVFKGEEQLNESGVSKKKLAQFIFKLCSGE